MKVKATYVTTVTVTDPDSGSPVDIQVYKDPESEAMFGVDASFLDQVTFTMPSPFNKGTVLVCMEPGEDEEDEEDKEDKEDKEDEEDEEEYGVENEDEGIDWNSEDDD